MRRRKTEPNYFEAFKTDLPKGTLDRITIDVKGTGRNTLSLIDETVRLRDEWSRKNSREYDQVWAVFDKDSFQSNQFNSAVFKARALYSPIQCAWSDEAFELWYMLHFDFVQDAMSRTQYKSRLEKALSTRMGHSFEYRKNDPEIYSLLKKFGSEAQAIAWARKLKDQYEDENFAAHNPCTWVYLLVIELRKLMDDRG